ncbi:MAG: DedA family protein [Candidatus Limnocylindria bacterium]
MDAVAIGGLAALLLVKEAGVPIPVPGDLLVIGAGVALAGDPPLAVAALAVILAVGYVGGSVQFLLARRIFRGPLLAGLARIGVGEARVEVLAVRLRRSGARGVALARMTPGIRIAAIAAAGVAAIPYATFLAGLVAGNGVFVAGHFALGYVLGASATELIASAGGIGLVIAAVAVLAILGAIAWAALPQAKRARHDGTRPYAEWADAACPACLAVTVARFRAE